MRKIFLSLLFLTICLNSWGKKTFVPRYTAMISIINGQDTASVTGNHTTLYLDDKGGMFRLAVIHEPLTMERIKFIKRQNNVAAMASFSAFVSAISSVSNDWHQRFRGRLLTYASGTLASIYSHNATAAKTLGIEIWVENTSNEEIIMSDNERGQIWFVSPGESYKLTIPNPEVLRLRISDVHHNSVKYVDVGAGSELRESNVEWENDRIWVFPILIRNEQGNFTADNYIVKDKQTGEQREVDKEELKAIKKN